MAKRCLIFFLMPVMTISFTYAQSLLSARAMSLGAYGALVKDSRSFESNPAGIVNMRDWEFASSTYSGTQNSGFVFQTLTLGKRFLSDEAVAVAYAPGAILEFALPAVVITSDSGVPATIQQRISYEENFLFAYAHRFSPSLSVGLTGRFRQDKVTDTKYELVAQGSGYVSKVTPRTETANKTAFDLGVMWKPLSNINLGMVARNLLAIQASLPTEFQAYNISAKRSAELSASIGLTPQWNVAFSGSTLGFGAVGTEIPALQNLKVRGGAYLNKDESPKIYALSLGLGWTYEFVEIDAGYVRFFGTGKHSANNSVTVIDVSRINNLDLNPYTSDRIMLSVKAIFGNTRESFVRIQSVEMLSGVYPSSYELFAFRPIGKVKVKNISDKPIQAKASFFVDRFMDAPTESQPVYMMPGQETEIPFSAVLNDQVRLVSSLTVREGNVYVSASSTDEPDDRFQVKMLIHGRNDWDGDVHSLRHFVTPDDPEVLRYTRDILLRMRDSLVGVPRELEQLAKARVLFNAFAGKLVYVGDPKQSSDYVQYPTETLAMQSGDCDDMTTCFVSLLSSVGISTAFIDVVPPRHPERSHIYMMFDTGIEPKFAGRISENPKRYVVRRDSKGRESVWLPIETTVITKGFEAAWATGAQEYLEDVEINLGIIKGWVRVIDIN